jgi:hypothetical protein
MKEPQIKTERVKVIYTEEELMTRLKFFIGICLAVTLMGIVFVVLYSIIFVTQPLNAISPVDSKFFELIIPIATFLTGTLSGIMLAGNNKEAQMKALEAANKAWDKSSTAPVLPPSGGFSASFSSTTASAPMGGFGDSMRSFDSGFGRQEPKFDMPTLGIVTNNGKPGPAQEPHPVI